MIAWWNILWKNVWESRIYDVDEMPGHETCEMEMDGGSLSN